MNSDDWISVKDRLPEEGQKVLMREPDYDVDEEGRFIDGHFDDYIGELNDDVVTHWQPLPGDPV